MKVDEVELLEDTPLTETLTIPKGTIVTCGTLNKTIFHHTGWYRFEELPNYRVVENVSPV